MLSELCLLFKAVEAVIASNLISARAPGAEQASEPVLQTASEPSQPAGKWQLFPAESDISYFANTVIKWNKSDFQVNKPDFNGNNNGQDNRILISDAIQGEISEWCILSFLALPPLCPKIICLRAERKRKQNKSHTQNGVCCPGWWKRAVTDGMYGNLLAKLFLKNQDVELWHWTTECKENNNKFYKIYNINFKKIITNNKTNSCFSNS